MTPSKTKSRRKRLFRLLLVTLAVLVISIAGLHIWFVNNARAVLKQIVSEKSHGKLKVELSKLSFDFFSNKLQIHEADLVSTDTVNMATSYHVKFRKLTLRIHSFWPLILERKLLLDSIKLHDPEIEVFQWRKDTVSIKPTKNDLSVSQEMGKLYNSMLDGLEAFGIRRIIINNAKLSMINKITPSQKPVIVSNIYLDIMRSDNAEHSRDEYIENEQNVVLRTTNQDIDLPSGRHRLSFKSFNLQLFQKRVELDSCTVTAFPNDSSRNSFKIFFNKLLLIGVDFNAMYRYNLIRADSVYCEKPFFDINIDQETRNAKTKKEKPNLEKMVREMTGDLDLAFVGVKDAGIHIDMIGSKKRSLFNSSRDNFEMRGFRINADSSRPVVVNRFDMLVRDYHLYNVDSSTAYTFDSIHFLNNKVVLNNFTVKTESGAGKIRDLRDFRVPHFELVGIDWFELVFGQNLKAQEAFLLNPVINFKKNTKAQRKKTNFFASLQTLDSLMTLDKIQIINGQVNMQFGAATSLVLENLNLSLHSNNLMKSTNREGLKRSVEFLSFNNGLVRIKDITARLNNIRFTGSDLLHADEVTVSSRSNRVKAQMNDVVIDNLIVDEKSERIRIDGLSWRKANIALKLLPAPPQKAGNSNIQLRNIIAGNTKLDISTGKATINTFLRTGKIASLVKQGSRAPSIQGLALSGSYLLVNSGSLSVKTGSYNLSDRNSFINDLQVEQLKPDDSISLKAPRLDFIPDINGILARDMHFNSIQIQSPVIRVHQWKRDTAVKRPGSMNLRIDAFTAYEPDIDIRNWKNDSLTRISIPFSENSSLKSSGIRVNEDGLSVSGLSLNTNVATLTKPNGEVVGVEKGKVDLSLSDIRLSQKEGSPTWSAKINELHLENPNSFALGKNKNKLSLERLSVGNLSLSSGYLANTSQLIRANVSAWLRSASGTYVDSNTTLKWYNAEYNYTRHSLSMDSFSYHPTQPRDSLIAHTPHQIDYITLKTGPLQLNDFNLEKYEKDSALIVNNMDVANPEMTIYRDKQPPFLTGIIKPLPVDVIRKISFPVSIERINIHDGFLSYTERHARTRAEGTLVLKRVNGAISNIRNQYLEPDDSMSLSLNAYVMDSAYIDLRVKESYVDTLGTFLMTLRMRPTTLAFLNPVLAPLSNVKITSGTIDSFQVRAIGHDRLAYGEMKMYYHNLRIQLVKGGDQNRSTLFTKVVSSLVNTFLVKKNNNGRTGLVYFERLRDRSFFNYIVKATFSGIATSIGVKKNRRYEKKYKKELKKRQLPDIEFLP
jgi:hypothetical protein